MLKRFSLPFLSSQDERHPKEAFLSVFIYDYFSALCRGKMPSGWLGATQGEEGGRHSCLWQGCLWNWGGQSGQCKQADSGLCSRRPAGPGPAFQEGLVLSRGCLLSSPLAIAMGLPAASSWTSAAWPQSMCGPGQLELQLCCFL